MQFSIALPTDHVDAAPEFVTGEAVAAVATTAEAAGFDACFVTDHPAPDSKWLAGGGHHALDPFVALSFAAAVTARLKVQTHILVLPYRNPLLT
ncbi:MAG: LLM class flavin-dependent oxidoreductase, partial [Actinomycetota bacterium]|nr:LLM class flavin-dependent oxidoreductase [Actinomycetota bacterium]